MNLKRPFFFFVIFYSLQAPAHGTITPGIHTFPDFIVAAGNQQGRRATGTNVILSSFNLLFTSDPDHQTGNTEFFIKYRIAYCPYIKKVYKFYLTEYNTQTIHVTMPVGTEVYRFRKAENLLELRLSYDL